jgi:hypothetical protein
VTGTCNLDTAVVINDSGADKDFRVEGDTDANLIFADASTDRVGVGTNTPAAKLNTSLSAGAAVEALRLTSNTNSAEGNSVRLAFSSQVALDQVQRVNAAIDVITNSVAASHNGTLTFSTMSAGALTERLRLDSVGNLGLGVTPSAWVGATGLQVQNAALEGRSTLPSYGTFSVNGYTDSGTWKYISTDFASRYTQFQGQHLWFTAPSGTAGNNITFSEVMRLSSSDRGVLTVGPSGSVASIGTDYATIGAWHVAGGGYRIYRGTGSGIASALFYSDSTASVIGSQENIPLSFLTNGTERARITSGGDLLVNATAQYGTEKFNVTQEAAETAIISRLSGGPYNNTSYPFIQGIDGTTVRFYLPSNGGLYNYQSNNVDLSDARTKKEITPAASMWDKIGALEIVTYKYNDQTHDDVNVGVIAQQVEAVEPVWVDPDGFGETPEGEEPLKMVYTKDIYFAAIKALQEAMARIEQLEADVAALKGT